MYPNVLGTYVCVAFWTFGILLEHSDVTTDQKLASSVLPPGECGWWMPLQDTQATATSSAASCVRHLMT